MDLSLSTRHVEYVNYDLSCSNQYNCLRFEFDLNCSNLFKLRYAQFSFKRRSFRSAQLAQFNSSAASSTIAKFTSFTPLRSVLITGSLNFATLRSN